MAEQPDAADPRRRSGDIAPIPDPNATGASEPLPGEPGHPGRERHEREAAFRRARMPLQVESPADSDLIARQAPHIFASLAENVRDYAIFLTDANGIIRVWGEGARLMKWWTKAQVVGSHLRLLYPDGGAEDGRAEDHLRTAAETGEYVGEGQRVRNDGSTFRAGIVLTALRGHDGSLVGFTKVTRDLTSQHAAQAAAVKSANIAAEGLRVREEAGRLRDLFVASVSHEIRAPLQALMGYLSLLEQKTTDIESQQSYITKIRRSATHLLEVVNDVLEVSRLQAGQFPITLGVARVGHATEAALSDIAPQAEAKGIKLVTALSGSAAEVRYWGDQSRVRQIVVNVLANAVKFTPPGGCITVSAGTGTTASPDSSLGPVGPWAYIRVEDTGEGIPPGRLEAIFEPFTQALVRDVHRGTGLGLSISRRLARLMGGDLSVQSEVGIGSTFILWLPIAPLLDPK